MESSSGYIIKGKPLESLPVPVLSAEIRSRGGKIKTNSIKSQIMAQLIEILDTEKEQQTIREKQGKRNTKLIIPMIKQNTTPTRNKNIQHHSSLIKSKKYKSREDFYNRFKNRLNDKPDETLPDTPKSNNIPPFTTKTTANTTTTTTTTTTTNSRITTNTPSTHTHSHSHIPAIESTTITTTITPSSKRKIINEIYQFPSSEDELASLTLVPSTSLDSNQKRPLKKLNFKNENNNNNNNNDNSFESEVNKTAIELEKKILHQYNLYPILERLPKSNKHIGYVLGKEYVRFIVLKVIEKDTVPSKLEPSPLINELWNAHILSTTKYDEFINLIQYKVHNDPDSFLDSKEKIINRFEKTISLYKKHFNSPPDPNIWVCPQ
ncbi:hypothetical protein ACTFIV_001297 [Dictyostelium citrinum]